MYVSPDVNDSQDIRKMLFEMQKKRINVEVEETINIQNLRDNTERIYYPLFY